MEELSKQAKKKLSYGFDVVKGSFITENLFKSKQKDTGLSISIAIYLH